MNNKAKSIALNLTLTIVALAGTAVGQELGQPYRLSDREVEQILRSVEKQADTFRQSLRAALNKSRLDGTRREDEINAFVRDFDDEAKRLRDRFKDHKSTAADVKSVLDRAALIDGFMSRNRLTPRVHNDWNALRSNLEQLAEVYNVTWRWDAPSAFGSPVVGAPFRLNDKDIERIMQNIERQSDKFRSSLDSALDRSRLDGTRREDDINAFVKDFYAATKHLREHFNDHKSTNADVQSVLDRAARIDQFMRRFRLSNNA